MLRTRHLGLVLALLLVGCAKEYVYIPPATEAGVQCVAGCQARQAQCRERATESAAAEKRACEETATAEVYACEANRDAEYLACQDAAEADYVGCRKYAPDPSGCIKQTCTLQSCTRNSCYQSANYSLCGSDFRACYQQCGGKIELMD